MSGIEVFNPDTPFTKLTRVEIFAHSGGKPYGLSDTFKGWTTRFCNRVGAEEVNRAIEFAVLAWDEKSAGTVGNGGWGRVYQHVNARIQGPLGEIDTSYLPQRDMGIFMFGALDMQSMGPANTLPSDAMVVFKNALRTVVSRFRCARIFEDDDFATGTATTTNGSTSLTLVTTATGAWTNGQYITGVSGIPTSTYIVSGAGTATMVLSKAATASAAGVAITGGTVSDTSGTWTASAAPTDGTRGASGNSARFAAADTNSRTIRIPPDFEGGTVVFGTFQDASRNSAQWAVTLDGSAVTSANSPQGNSPYDFRDAFAREYPSTVAAATNPKRSPACVRITGLAAGAHTIVTTVQAHSGTNPAWWDWWGIEAAVPPLVCLMKHPRTPIYATTFPYTMSDSDVTATLNPAIESVASEFAAYTNGTKSVFTFDTDAVLGKDPNYFLESNTHCNEEGNALIARELYRQVAAIYPGIADDQRARSAGFQYVSVGPNDKDRNMIQSGNFLECPLSIANTAGQDPTDAVSTGTPAALTTWLKRDKTTALATVDRYGSFKPAGATQTVFGMGDQWLGPVSSQNHAAINTFRYGFLYLPMTALVTGLSYVCGATSNGNDRLSMYSADGATRYGLTTAAAQPTANNSVKRNFAGGAVTLAPGIYIVGLWLASATGTAYEALSAWTAGTTTDADGDIPVTLAPPTYSATAFVPQIATF